jgi:hypothetical protein
VIYEALESQGTVGGLDASGLLGKPFSGVLGSDGEITFSETPPTPSELARYFDPAAFLSQLLMPLPQGGATGLESWPVHQEATERTEMTVTTVFTGTARIVGDTTWNGVAAKIVAVEGEFEMEGSGTPTGSPAELDMILTGTGTSRFVWDAARGVMLASVSEGSGTGTVAIPSMDLAMPMSLTSKQTTELQR